MKEQDLTRDSLTSNGRRMGAHSRLVQRDDVIPGRKEKLINHDGENSVEEFIKDVQKAREE